MTLQGTVVVVTGAARGIGFATAEALAREGAVVVIGDLDPREAEAAAARIGSGALGLALDVTDPKAFTGFLDEVERSLGPIGVMINNAGIMPLSPLVDEDDEVTVRQLEVNLHGVIHGTREAARRMLTRGEGHIVNIASFAGKIGFPGAATYCATKHGVVGLSESVRHELRGTGIEVSVVMPAVVRTELTSGLAGRAVKPVSADEVAKAIVRALRRPRFDVFVPSSGLGMNRFLRLLPRRASEWLLWRTGVNDTLTAISPDERAAYDSRVSAGWTRSP
jgi:NAD(P)-dependent dehydrogenase (short-subunit alcohol dehydrogenase family)